eukprot:Skav200396  [mRNA]  locus=scaffold1919:156792:162160:- [translate_table: standard]
MQPGHVALVNYGERPATWHARLLLGRVDGDTWMILTPDYDMYSELLSPANGDYTDFEYLGSQTRPPARIPARQIYGFAPLDPGTLANYIHQGQQAAEAERRALGLPAGGAVGPAPALAAPPAPPGGAVPLPGVLVGGPPAAGAPVAVAAAAPNPGVVGPKSWVAIESSGGRKRGDVVVVEPAALPPGHVVLGDRGVVPGLPGHVEGCMVRLVAQDEVAKYQLEDLRVLPVKFDAQGLRRREFGEAISMMVDSPPMGGGLQLEGPTSILNVLKSMRDQSLTPTTFHEFWLRSADIPRGDRSTYEHECLSRILESLVSVDQLNVAALQGAELIGRRLQVIREAHRVSPSSPDYSSADYFMGWKYRRGSQGVDNQLAQHVASEMKADAAIMKEARKAKEEAQARRQKPKGEREAAQELLHTSVDYSNDGPTSTVRSYDRDLISLPQSGDQPVDLMEVLDDLGRDFVKDPLTAMMISEEEHGQMIEKGDIVKPYMDVRLQKEQDTYEIFIHDLFKCGMIDFTSCPQDIVTPFCVHKKNNRLRLILDCRMVNKRFRHPPGVALAAGSTWSQVALPAESTLWVAQSDIKDYFYSLAMPEPLRDFFCLPSIRSELLQEWGLDLPKMSNSLDPQVVFPRLRTIPMGWNWAMWIAQRVHQNISLRASGLPHDRVVVEGRAPPSLEGGEPILIPYADNLNVAGLNPERVQETKDAVVAALRGHGFRVHEELDASDCAQSLGFLVDGASGIVQPVPEKLHKVRQAFRWLAGRPRVRGREVERLLGHATHLMMLRRELLSIFRSLYDFVQGSYHRRSRLWPSATREARWAADLLGLCSVDMRRAWSQVMTASDASLSGLAVTRSEGKPIDIERIGSQREPWRYRLKTSLAPRARSLQLGDPFEDPATVKPLKLVEPDPYELNYDFEEVPDEILNPDKWVDAFAIQMLKPEHITLLEGRAVVAALRHKFRSSAEFSRKHLHFNDNMSVCLMCSKGRSGAYSMLRVCRRICCLLLATDSLLNAILPGPKDQELGLLLPSTMQDSPKGKRVPSTPTRWESSLKEKIGSRQKKVQARDDPARFVGQTNLERMAVSIAVSKDYTKRMMDFKMFVQHHKLKMNPMKKLDEALCYYLNSLYEQGLEYGEGSKSLAAVIDSVPGCGPRHLLPRSRRALQGWQKQDPQKTRPPLPWPLVAAIALHMLENHKLHQAALVLVMFSAYLRPGEAVNLQRSDLVAPIPGHPWYALHLHPSARQETSKVGLSDESLLLDAPQFCEAIRNTCQGTCGISHAAKTSSTTLHPIRTTTSKGGPKIFRPQASSWNGRYVIELFSGCSRLSRCLAQRGYTAIAYDIDFGRGCNLLDEHVVNQLVAFVKRHHALIDLIWLGTPCTSWSRARRWDGGPQPLRDDSSNLMGYPGLCAQDIRKVLDGNSFLEFSYKVTMLASSLGLRWVMENPWTSRIWLTSQVQTLLRNGAVLQQLDFCAYGMPWKKSTGLLSYNFPSLKSIMMTCHPSANRCEYSGHRHITLTGKDSSGMWWTRRAQPYPPRMCQLIASLLPV